MVLERLNVVWRCSGTKHFCSREKLHCYKKLARNSGEKRREFSQFYSKSAIQCFDIHVRVKGGRRSRW